MLGTLDVIFCSDDYLLKINQEFLHHHYLTDIITFDLSDSNQSTAEIYISVDRIRENARIYQVSIASELLRVIFHGVLHLCGYGDKTSREISLMRKKETHWLEKYQQAR